MTKPRTELGVPNFSQQNSCGDSIFSIRGWEEMMAPAGDTVTMGKMLPGCSLGVVREEGATESTCLILVTPKLAASALGCCYPSPAHQKGIHLAAAQKDRVLLSPLPLPRLAAEAAWEGGGVIVILMMQAPRPLWPDFSHALEAKYPLLLALSSSGHG